MLDKKNLKNSEDISQTMFGLKQYQAKITKALNVELPAQFKAMTNLLDFQAKKALQQLTDLE